MIGREETRTKLHLPKAGSPEYDKMNLAGSAFTIGLMVGGIGMAIFFSLYLAGG
jgi:hypothetical protein